MSGPPKELLERQSLNRLLVYALADWVAIAAIWWVMVHTPGWTWPLWMLLIAGRLHALGVLLHDLCHLPLRGKSPTVYLLEILCGYPIASTLEAMRYHHLRHHRLSNTCHDPYLHSRTSTLDQLLGAVRGLVIMPAWSLRAPFGLACLRFPKLRNSYARIFLQDRSGKDRTESFELIRCAQAERGQVVFQGCLLLALCLTPIVIWGYLVPLLVAGVLSAIRLNLEHSAEVLETVTHEGVLRTTRDHSQSLWTRLLIGPHHVGYHVMHHLHPEAGFHNLPELSEWYGEQ